MTSRRLSHTIWALTLSAGITAASGTAWADRYGDASSSRPEHGQPGRDGGSVDRHNERWQGHDRRDDHASRDRAGDRWRSDRRDRGGDTRSWQGRDGNDRRGSDRYDSQWNGRSGWQQPYRGYGSGYGNGYGNGYGGGYNGYRNDDRYRQGYGYRIDGDRHWGGGASYRYSYRGRYYETSDYGAQLLRNALSFGYRQGVLAARAALSYRSGYDLRGCAGYRDGSYGYEDGYIDQDQYSYYYRQGFERGYNEAYYGRYQYGYYRNGAVEVVADLLDLILDLRHIH